MAFVTAALITGGIAAAGGIGGAIISANGANNAAQTQADAANQASQLQYKMFQQQQDNQQPWQQAGAAALPQLSNMASNPKTFSMQDFYNNQDPAYQFDLQQGQQALERSAAAKGGLMSAGTLKDLSNYSRGQASNEYQNAYSRFTNNQTNQFNRLASIAGIGQTANGQMGAAGQTLAAQVGNNITGAGNAAAASQIAQGNTWGSTLSGIGSQGANTWMGYNMLNRFAPQQSAPSFGSYADSQITNTPQMQMPAFGSSFAGGAQ